MLISDVYARSPQMRGFLELGSPYTGMEALAGAGVLTVEQLNLGALYTPGFGKASLEYLALVLADEVKRLEAQLALIHRMSAS